jgi:hypothetical protein
MDSPVVAWSMAGALGLAVVGGAVLPMLNELARRSREGRRRKQPWEV